MLRLPDEVAPPRLNLDEVAPELKEKSVPRYVETTPIHARTAVLLNVLAVVFNAGAVLEAVVAGRGVPTTNALLAWIGGNLMFGFFLAATRRRVFVREIAREDAPPAS